jgi:hypothetical protein
MMLNINKQNWPVRLLLAAFIAASIFLVTLPIAPANIRWLYLVLLVIGSGGFIISTAVLFARAILRGIAWVKGSETIRKRIWRASCFGLVLLIGIPAAVMYWFLPLIASFSFFGAAL